MGGHPDVVVLGMPSSGKTVFLSVLGHKFNLAEEEGSPLGFRMHPRGLYTRDMVDLNFAALAQGKWPDSTNRGQKTDLEWDVFTGKRKIFSLSSMDISGETFREAFGNGKSVSRRNDIDALLGEQDSTENGAYTADQLREAVKDAKCVCLFVNVSTKNDKQRRNFNEAMVAMCNMLDRDPMLRRKTIVVLTQTHARANEIERAGGAVAFLNDNNSTARSLYVIVKDNQIPVIAVSAVNEEPGNENLIPRNFKSDGLFGFLLMVSGLTAGGSIARVKDDYAAYLKKRTQAYQRPCRLLGERLSRYEGFRDAGRAFHRRCLKYLADKSNLCDNDDDPDGFYRSVIDDHTRSTNTEPSVWNASHGWEIRLRIDQTWDACFKATVWNALPEAPHTPPDNLYAQVAERISQGDQTLDIPGEVGIYGFTEDQLAIAQEAEDYQDWARKSEVAYREKLDGAINELDDAVNAFNGAVGNSAKASLVDNPGLIAELERLQAIAQRRMDDLLKAWAPPDRANQRSEFPEPLHSISHNLYAANCGFDDLLKRREKEFAARARAKRIRMTLKGVFATAVFCVFLYGVWSYFRSMYLTANESRFGKLKQQVDLGNYEGVEQEIAELESYPFFLVDGKSLLPHRFSESLRSASELKSVREDAQRQMESLGQLKRQKLPLDRDTPSTVQSELERTLNAIDMEWKQLPPLPNFQTLAESPQMIPDAQKATKKFLDSLQSSITAFNRAVAKSDQCRRKREEMEAARILAEKEEQERQKTIRKAKVDAAFSACRDIVKQAREAAEAANACRTHDKPRVLKTLTCEKRLVDALKRAKQEMDGEAPVLTPAHYQELSREVQQIRNQLPILIQIKVFSGSDKNHPGDPVDVNRFNPSASALLSSSLEDFFVILSAGDMAGAGAGGQTSQSCAFLEIAPHELNAGGKILTLRLRTKSGKVVPIFVRKKDLVHGVNRRVHYLQAGN